MAEIGDLFGLKGASEVEDAGESEETAAKKEVVEIDGTPPHLVEAFCASISRLALGRRLYSPDNKLLRMMEERVDDAWKLVAARNEPIAIDVNDGNLAYHDHVVFQQDDRDTIAHKLYRDSVRRVFFSPKADVDEIARFLTVFDDSETLWQHEADCANGASVRYHAGLPIAR